VVERDRSRGFTLIELLVGVALAGVVAAGIYAVYASQQKTYMAQEQVAAMQQNLRAAMFYMEREIRLAGCDPTGRAHTGFVDAEADTVTFTADIRGDAEGSEPDGDALDPHESISYGLNQGNLVRNGEVIAENVDALNFVYLDGSGQVTTSLSSIRSVEITIVAGTGRKDPGYVGPTSYRNQQGEEIFSPGPDGFRRKLLSTNIKCRNMGF